MLDLGHLKINWQLAIGNLQETIAVFPKAFGISQLKKSNSTPDVSEQQFSNLTIQQFNSRFIGTTFNNKTIPIHRILKKNIK
jgi:hypothetical protein